MSTAEAGLMTLAEAPQDPQVEPWADAEVLRIVKKDFETAEEFRKSNHDPRWALADQLYFGYEKQRYWKGSKIPRSSLGMFVVFQQVESMLPKVLSSIFADNPWFEVGPQPGTTGRDALDVRDLMLYQLEMARRYQNQSVREVFRRAIKSGFLYGNGIVELYWMDQVRKIRKLFRQMVPQTVPHPLYGVPMPTGQVRPVIGERFIEKRDQFPCLKNVSIKDFYIDPNCEGPQVQMAGYAIKRALMTISELEDLARYDERFKLPSREKLEEFAKKKPTAQSDMSKRWAESTRSVDWSPEVDTGAAPGAGRIEVLSWWTPERTAWTLNREHVCLNEENEYGLIPFYNTFYTDAPDRFYGISVTDVTEGEHRLQGAIINARIDELALTIHGTTIKKRGFSIPQSQLSQKPGRMIEADNPKEDIVFGQTQNITQQAPFEVAASELRVQKTTGITDLAVMGVQSSGGNSANRTATGVGAQVQAAFSRITYLLENIEDVFVEPILTGIHALNTRFLDPERYVEIMNPNGEPVTLDPLRVLNADVQFTMRASAKMQSRMALVQQFPALAQALLNPGIFTALQAQGLTLDMGEFLQIFADATSYSMRGSLIRPMTPQEQQAFQRSQSMEHNTKLQLQRERMKDLETLQEKEGEDEMMTTLLKEALPAVLNGQKEDESG